MDGVWQVILLTHLWRRCFPEKPSAPTRPTDLSGDIAVFEAMQRAYVDKLCDEDSLARLEKRKAGLTQKLKYDESANSLLGL